MLSEDDRIGDTETLQEMSAKPLMFHGLEFVLKSTLTNALVDFYAASATNRS